MHPHPVSSGRHWDGSPRRIRPRRSLYIAAHSPSRLLRAGQTGRCRDCGNRIDWHQRANGRPLALHPAEVPAADVPAPCRWHLNGGIAHPHDDGSGWCRIPHAVLCPQRVSLARTGPRLTPLRRHLAVRTRRLIDTGTLTPAPCTPATTAPHTDRGHPRRPVVRILLTHYLGDRPTADIRCIAQTRHRHRCTHPVHDPRIPAGRWRLLPTAPQPGQLTLSAQLMAVYDLQHLAYAEQLRWRTQRCPAHATAPGAADLTPAAWQPFDPLLHAAHIHPHLPPPTAQRRPQ
ncbi:hypothetical protein J2X68_007735 [Streptomyces sp. 3330]|uniref:DUF6083 domain-containing protein n=1 Tax=Streptomyces sp. 3330 TaxID=2817755 RepID=UPI002855F364|nr:DUF6083 domain-containing protein [Streptomyces sp. 3330]MDR6980993.1 hypothetical protein [Streptomyces sp. 3330]